MRIETILHPAEIGLLTPDKNAGWTCVVFDILRATTTIVTALAHGAKIIHPVGTIEEARGHRRTHGPDWLLGGERHGDRIEGFDLGNSPSEYLHLPGKKIVSTTTNGTVALKACHGADRIYAASLLNLSATSAHLRAAGTQRLRLICAGTFANFALEDGVAAGLLARQFPAAELCDATRAMVALMEENGDGWKEKIRSSTNGCALQKAGRQTDIDWALQLDTCPAVVLCDSGGCRAVSTPGAYSG
jgi:2-phosphosulfolactate phosphatase